MKELAGWLVAVVVLIGLGWWFGTPYYLHTAMSGLPEKQAGAPALVNLKWSCTYRGMQGERRIDVEDGECARIRLFRWK